MHRKIFTNYQVSLKITANFAFAKYEITNFVSTLCCVTHYHNFDTGFRRLVLSLFSVRTISSDSFYGPLGPMMKAFSFLKFTHIY
jgi:hypothetical protein